MVWLMVLLSFAGGTLLAVQSAVNGRLGVSVGVFKSAFLTFSIGALLTALLIFFFEPSRPVTLMDVPKWQLLGALMGVPYIIIMVLAVQRIGAATATIAVIFGQLLMSMLIDSFGWLGNARIPFSYYRLGAVLCLGAALYFIYQSSAGRGKKQSGLKLPIPACFIVRKQLRLNHFSGKLGFFAANQAA